MGKTSEVSGGGAMGGFLSESHMTSGTSPGTSHQSTSCGAFALKHKILHVLLDGLLVTQINQRAFSYPLKCILLW